MVALIVGSAFSRVLSAPLLLVLILAHTSLYHTQVGGLGITDYFTPFDA